MLEPCLSHVSANTACGSTASTQGVTWVGTRSKFFPSILLMCFLAWDVIWCLSRKENWQPSRMQWKWLFTWLYLQPADTNPILCCTLRYREGAGPEGRWLDRTGLQSTWISDGLNIISGHGLFRNSLEGKDPKPTIYSLLSNYKRGLQCAEI